MIHRTSTAHAPWHVVPSDHKWAARVMIGSAIVSALEKLDLQYPRVDAASLKESEAVRKALEAEEQAEKAAKKASKGEK